MCGGRRKSGFVRRASTSQHVTTSWRIFAWDPVSLLRARRVALAPDLFLSPNLPLMHGRRLQLFLQVICTRYIASRVPLSRTRNKTTKAGNKQLVFSRSAAFQRNSLQTSSQWRNTCIPCEIFAKSTRAKRDLLFYRRAATVPFALLIPAS